MRTSCTPKVPRTAATRRKAARRRAVARSLAGLALLLYALVPVHAGDEAAPPRLSRVVRTVARLDVPVREISGWSALPSSEKGVVRFLAVVDEGTYDASERAVGGALHALAFTVGEDDGFALTSHHAVTLRLGDLIPRLDPTWAGGGSLLDLEACVPLPGTPDLFLLAGERNPEDATDGGANRLYVVRYPGRGMDATRSSRHADLLAYLRLPDLADDAINDRLEAVAAVGGASHDTWRVFAFKERTESKEHPPVYFPLVLRRVAADADGASEKGEPTAPFVLTWDGGGGSRRRLPSLLPLREELGAQSDACLDAAGRVWVLDRWRREIHIAKLESGSPDVLRLELTADLFDLIEDVAGECAAHEPAAHGGRHAGYGRHEALTFDAEGRLWLAADLGERAPSVVTVLAPHPGGSPLHRAVEAEGD